MSHQLPIESLRLTLHTLKHMQIWQLTVPKQLEPVCPLPLVEPDAKCGFIRSVTKSTNACYPSGNWDLGWCWMQPSVPQPPGQHPSPPLKLQGRGESRRGTGVQMEKESCRDPVGSRSGIWGITVACFIPACRIQGQEHTIRRN